MKAMVLEKIGDPLTLKEVPKPSPGEFEVLIKVRACGVCRTDLHIVEGELNSPKLPLILGHQIVGIIEEVGCKVSREKIGKRIGVAWLGRACGKCEFCLSSRENLCDYGVFTGYNCNGGYAEYCIAQDSFVVDIPEKYDDVSAAPLLCAGLIGYRALRLVGEFESVGFYGFGSSAHLLIQAARYLEKKVYVFTRPNDQKTVEFALSLGATWAGGSDEAPPKLLDAAILFAPTGSLYPAALKVIKKGGKVISAGIHMSDIPSFSYSLLWEERSISSVANLTRRDALEFMTLASELDFQIKTSVFPLKKANEALEAIKKGKVEGSVVLSL
jgi:alcohol dehydrogenase, propanol-preferring